MLRKLLIAAAASVGIASALPVLGETKAGANSYNLGDMDYFSGSFSHARTDYTATFGGRSITINPSTASLELPTRASGESLGCSAIKDVGDLAYVRNSTEKGFSVSKPTFIGLNGTPESIIRPGYTATCSSNKLTIGAPNGLNYRFKFNSGTSPSATIEHISDQFGNYVSVAKNSSKNATIYTVVSKTDIGQDVEKVALFKAMNGQVYIFSNAYADIDFSSSSTDSQFLALATNAVVTFTTEGGRRVISYKNTLTPPHLAISDSDWRMSGSFDSEGAFDNNYTGFIFRKATKESVEICNPLGACAVASNYKSNGQRPDSKWDERIHTLKYFFPSNRNNDGNIDPVTVNISYSYSGSNENRRLTVTSEWVDAGESQYSKKVVRVYEAPKIDSSADLTGHDWKSGNLVTEETWVRAPDGKPVLSSRTTTDYEKYHLKAPGTTTTILSIAMSRVKAVTTERFNTSVGTNTPASLGIVKKTFSDYDSLNQAGLITYEYPTPGALNTPLFSKVEQHIEYATNTPKHLTGMVSKQFTKATSDMPSGTSTFHSVGESSNTYDGNGLLLTSTVNGVTTTYTYHAGTNLLKTSTQVVEGQRKQVSSFKKYKFGIVGEQTSPDNSVTTRTATRDNKGLVVTETYQGRTTVSHYDVFGNLRVYDYAESKYANSIVNFMYPAFGNLPTPEQLRSGKVPAYKGGMLTVRSTANDASFFYTYTNGQGLVVAERDIISGAQNTDTLSINDFDGFGNLTNESMPFNTSQLGSYGPEAIIPIYSLNIPASVGRVHYNKDVTGRTFSIEKAGEVQRFEFPKPFQTKHTDPNGNSVTEDYRPFSGWGSEQIVKRTFQSGASVPAQDQQNFNIKLDRYGNGLLSRTVHSNGHTTNYLYDSQWRLKEIETPEETYGSGRNGIRHTYYSNGWLKTKQVANGLLEYYEYDDLGRPKLISYRSSVSGAGSATMDISFDYNDVANTTVMHRNGYTWTEKYDKDGLLAQEILAVDKNVSPQVPVAFPAFQRTESAKTLSGGATGGTVGCTAGEECVNHTFNANTSYQTTLAAGSVLDHDFRILEVTPETNVIGFNYVYNQNRILEAVSYPDGEVVNLAPDSLGRATQLHTGLRQYISNVRYHADNSLHKFTYGNGVEAVWSKDPASAGDRLGALAYRTNANDLIVENTYGYTNESYVNYISTRWGIAASATPYTDTVSIRYDNLYQMTLAQYSETNPSRYRTERYNYDALGNIESYNNLNNTDVGYTYNAATNHLTNFNGARVLTNSIGAVEEIDGRAYRYNQAGQLTQEWALDKPAEKINYQYDSRGLLAVKETSSDSAGQVRTYYGYTADGKLRFEIHPDGEWTNYFYLRGNLVATRKADYTVRHGICDRDDGTNRSMKINTNTLEAEFYWRAHLYNKAGERVWSAPDCARAPGTLKIGFAGPQRVKNIGNYKRQILQGIYVVNADGSIFEPLKSLRLAERVRYEQTRGARVWCDYFRNKCSIFGCDFRRLYYQVDSTSHAEFKLKGANSGRSVTVSNVTPDSMFGVSLVRVNGANNSNQRELRQYRQYWTWAERKPKRKTSSIIPSLPAYPSY